MRKLTRLILFFCLASPAWATTYFLAPASSGGNDSNNGTSASTPWLTPNHPVNCGDVIIAAASSSYVPANFTYGNWGTVTCTGGNNVAWLKCVTFDACKMSISSTDGFDVDQSYWGIQGWEVDGTTASGPCFFSYPSRNVEVHHIIFANDIASGCGLSGFSAGGSGNGTAGVDYWNVIGSIAYNATGGSTYCGSGITVYEPIASDSLPGTHIYLAGNFSWDNVDGNPCAGTPSTDGEGILLDTFDGSQTGTPVYTQQALIDNNIAFLNGAKGIDAFSNRAGSTHASIYFRHNTAYGNNTAAAINLATCAEIMIDSSVNVQASQNLAVTAAALACTNHTLSAYQVNYGDATVSIHDNFGYSAAGNNAGSNSSSAFSIGPNNIFGTNPNLVNPVDPGAPSCGTASSVPNCMTAVIANFTPQAAAAKGYGYQAPSTTQKYDPLFPQWLCNVNLPAGLVTMGCLAGSSTLTAPVISGVKVQ